MPADNNAIAQRGSRQVSAEFGLTVDKGYTVSGSQHQSSHLYELYNQPRSVYWIVELHGQLAQHALTFACEHGFCQHYLETTATLDRAIALYEQLGFYYITDPMGNAGHVDCEFIMLKTL